MKKTLNVINLKTSIILDGNRPSSQLIIGELAKRNIEVVLNQDLSVDITDVSANLFYKIPCEMVSFVQYIIGKEEKVAKPIEKDSKSK